MAVLDVITVGDPRLRQRSRLIRQITPELKQFAMDMVETMHAQDGVGLAAVQVGKLWSMIVIEIPENEKIPGSGVLYIVVNPEILRASREVEAGREGCLSVPGYVGEVERATEVIVRGIDLNGKAFRLRARDYLARVFQHEIDHCNGILYIDKLTAPENIWPVEEGEEEQIEMQEAAAAAEVAA